MPKRVLVAYEDGRRAKKAAAAKEKAPPVEEAPAGKWKEVQPGWWKLKHGDGTGYSIMEVDERFMLEYFGNGFTEGVGGYPTLASAQAAAAAGARGSGVAESSSSVGESPTREEWEVVVTNPPAAYRGRILNLVPPGDGFAAGNKIILQGFHDDEEARHVATGIAQRYGVLVTYGPKRAAAAETSIAQETKAHDCGCGRSKTTVEKTEVNVLAVGGAEERGITTDVGAVCKPFTRIERDPALFQACMLRAKEIGEFKDSGSFYDLVAPEIVKRDSESFFVVCIDFRGQLRDFVEVAIGQRHKVGVDIEDILAIVILSRCDGFAIAHCHPSGHAAPSDADKRLTREIRASANGIPPCKEFPDGLPGACPNIPMVDHLIVGLNEFYSFTDKKLYKRK